MNVLEKLAGSTPDVFNDITTKALEMKCDEMYDRYVTAYRTEYPTGTPASKFMFLAMPWDWVKALEHEPGTLVTLQTKDPNDPMNNAYAIVDAWGVNVGSVFLLCTRSDGMQCVAYSGWYKPADLPKGVLEIAKRAILKDCKCPLKEECL